MLKSCVNQRAILVANERNEDISLQHVSCLSTKQQNNMIPHNEPKKKSRCYFSVSPVVPYLPLHLCEVKYSRKGETIKSQLPMPLYSSL